MKIHIEIDRYIEIERERKKANAAVVIVAIACAIVVVDDVAVVATSTSTMNAAISTVDDVVATTAIAFVATSVICPPERKS